MQRRGKVLSGVRSAKTLRYHAQSLALHVRYQKLLLKHLPVIATSLQSFLSWRVQLVREFPLNLRDLDLRQGLKAVPGQPFLRVPDRRDQKRDHRSQ